MTANSITQEVREAAEYVVYGHRRIPLDHPDMQSAHRTLQAAGVWSPAEVVGTRPDPAHIEVAVVGVFAANDRHRVVHMVLADGVEIGTAIHWTGKVLYPWGLSLPAINLVNFGFRDRASLLRAVERFVRTGEIARWITSALTLATSAFARAAPQCRQSGGFRPRLNRWLSPRR
jgi:hypothetical protein